jgi:hypothetical protein
METATALASIVLPTPGTSSMRRCPAASTAVVAATTAPGVPRTTAFRFAWSDAASSRASSSDGFTVASLTRSSVVMDNTSR